MTSQQEMLDKLVGVRTDIIEALVYEFKDTDLSINIDDKTGAITFDASILFEFGKSELKDSGKNFLNEFLPRYVHILQSEEFQSDIAEIIIEGHTDSVGTYLNNLELSQNRALAVARYCLAEGDSILEASSMEKLRGIVTANGRSYSNLILKDDGTEDAEVKDCFCQFSK